MIESYSKLATYSHILIETISIHYNKYLLNLNIEWQYTLQNVNIVYTCIVMNYILSHTTLGIF